MTFIEWIETVGKAVDAVGVATMIIGGLIATYLAVSERNIKGLTGIGCTDAVSAERSCSASSSSSLRTSSKPLLCAPRSRVLVSWRSSCSSGRSSA